ncbi:hypothetical protein CTDIVETGP_2144 [Clostridium tyrobutyricum DIVETGP]|uniref:Uncharacterized protein n=1 Tax=Clostridium tyrobutyricum DIVETGP TaxID=1408889 RepID=W6N994_CLOTY|nr:hypothetical protein CTK_C03690 [Clostridium tyrobutyricum]CDL92074.1 hypothetical protein CTDIVETGP_2144 [Clostridium tyrobutyricum DIVETGP]
MTAETSYDKSIDFIKNYNISSYIFVYYEMLKINNMVSFLGKANKLLNN